MSATDQLTPRQAMLALSALPRLGPVTIRRLLAAFGEDPIAVLQARASQLQELPRIGAETAKVLANWRSHVDPLALEARLQRAGIDFLCIQDADYPVALRQIYDPPVGLYCKGPLRLNPRSVAIVGSRRTTLYGQSTAQMLGRELASLGFCVVSGMARGIDTAAHKGALSVGGDTVAVFGCGVDIVYPPENIDLYQQIVAKGMVVSELPPGTRASRSTFPMRNRLISGLAAAVIVVETDKQGGSMITARFAAEHNRPLFAVPGRIDQSTSQGCHQLIREGAILLTCVDDLLEELAYGGRATAPEPLPFYEGSDNGAVDGNGSVDSNGMAGDNDAAGGSGAADSSSGIAVGADDAAGTGKEGGVLELRSQAAGTAHPATDAPASASDWQEGLDEEQVAVLATLLEGDRLDRDAIASRAGLPVAAVAAALLMLELRRRVNRRADGSFEARPQ